MNKGAQRVFACLLAGALLAVGGPAWAEQAREAQRWLERMTRAVKTLNYRGTFVYNHEGRLETMQLIHRVDEDGERERLYAMTGPNREILRDNEKVTSILPENGAVRVDWRQSSNPFADVLPSDIAPLREHYSFQLNGEGRVAGRVAQVIAILPRDEYRYGYRLWVDAENGLLLRSDLLSGEGEMIEQLLFTHIEVVDIIPDEWLQPSVSGEDFVRISRERRQNLAQRGAAGARWQAEAPPGFELRARRVHRQADGGGTVEHLLYSDGLGSVSVYVEPAASEQAFSGPSRVGAVTAYGRWDEGVQFTVVGEVPVQTTARIAKSLRPAGER